MKDLTNKIWAIKHYFATFVFCLHFRHWVYESNLSRQCKRCGRKERYLPFVPEYSSDLVIGIGRSWQRVDY